MCVHEIVRASTVTHSHALSAYLLLCMFEQYAIARPKRVSSLILCNSFYSTTAFLPTAGSMVCALDRTHPHTLMNVVLHQRSSTNNCSSSLTRLDESVRVCMCAVLLQRAMQRQRGAAGNSAP
jgi:hypothetical protein